MSLFSSPWEIERSSGGGWADTEESGEVDDEVFCEERSFRVRSLEDQQSAEATGSEDSVGLFQGVFG